MSFAYSYWVDEGHSQLVRGAQNIALIESRGSRAASDLAMNNQVNKNNRHLGIAKSTEGGDKTAIHFYDSVMQRYGTGTFKNFGSITLDDIKGDKVVAFLNVFLEILTTKFIPKGWATPNGWNQAKPTRLASVPTYFSKIHTQLKAQFGPTGHEYLQGCSSKSAWWTAMLGTCNKGYKDEVFLGDDEIFKVSTRPLYLHLP